MRFGKRVESVPYLKDVLEIIIAFIVAWLFYQGLAIAAGTPVPIVSVVSGSMEPVLHRGDLVFVIKPDNLKVGDVVVYNKLCTKADVVAGLCTGGSVSIIHRIIEKMEDVYIIKGDNNRVPDSGVIRQEQIEGKVLFAMPLLGYPRLALYAVGI